MYALELDTGRLRQVTNVLTGAYMAEPSPDGKTLAYVGYTTAGFDLFAMPLDEATWTDAAPYVDDRPTPAVVPQKHWDVKPYNAWPTLILPLRRRDHRGQLRSCGRHHGITVRRHRSPYGHRDVGYRARKAGAAGLASRTVTGACRSRWALVFRSDHCARRLPARSTTSPYHRARDDRASRRRSAYTQEHRDAARARTCISHSIARIGSDIPVPNGQGRSLRDTFIPARGVTSSVHLAYWVSER